MEATDQAIKLCLLPLKFLILLAPSVCLYYTSPCKHKHTEDEASLKVLIRVENCVLGDLGVCSNKTRMCPTAEEWISVVLAQHQHPLMPRNAINIFSLKTAIFFFSTMESP